MNILTLRSYGKINLSLDILGKLPDGYHQLSMVLQQIALHDEVSVRYVEGKGEPIQISSNKPYLPTDERNLAYKGAALMQAQFGAAHRGRVRVDLKKRIPVGAGLAGGSGNGAAVLLALNHLWGLALPLKELCTLGEKLGSDVPFCIRGQAYTHDFLGYREDPLALTCALAEGTGIQLTKLPPLGAYVVLSKPPLSVSTREAYAGFDEVSGKQRVVHPDTRALIEGLQTQNMEKVKNNMGNVLELHTLTRYDKAVYTKNKMQESCRSGAVLMSGSGPTIFALLEDRACGEYVYNKMKAINRETFLTETLR